MAYDQKLAERIRAELQGSPILEKKMFGGARQLGEWVKIGVEFAASLPPR